MQYIVHWMARESKQDHRPEINNKIIKEQSELFNVLCALFAIVFAIFYFVYSFVQKKPFRFRCSHLN
jgi:hypothetical protein